MRKEQNRGIRRLMMTDGEIRGWGDWVKMTGK
jgi:hypothetical protein